MEYKQQFERDFMRRTLELVRTYHGPYDPTNLLNCLLGLLIVPKETSIEKVPDEPIADLGRWGISPQSIESFGRNHPKTCDKWLGACGTQLRIFGSSRCTRSISASVLDFMIKAASKLRSR